ncbi:hypothetical protein GCM10010149_65730 [Nonomuraea roseoviolacea subsp. roseoviolacea]|uniref:dienelactone hydrolase family protein n=1 Tax=Nonomuraea roseoviolacea TaxID=103837 RepID=UPI0031DEA927
MQLTGIQADIMAAAERLGRPAVALGFCRGGRNAFLASAPRFGFAGVIGFYGVPGIAGPYGPGPTQQADELSAPTSACSAAGVRHELVTCPGAAHGFFDAEYGEHRAACEDDWKRVLEFLTAA